MEFVRKIAAGMSLSGPVILIASFWSPNDGTRSDIAFAALLLFALGQVLLRIKANNGVDFQ